nr:hypothetical protein [Tanacetum cinerariifolium]
MTTLAEFMIVAGADNRPPMLDKPIYESWKSCMELYIQGKDHGWIILNSVENGPLIWPTTKQEDGTVRLKTYEELSDKEKLQTDCDLKETNIVLQEQEDDTVRFKTYEELSDKEKLQTDCDLKETNIVLQGLSVPTFLPGDDPIACMNKAMAFSSAVFSPRYPSTNNQLRSSSNPRNQATVQHGSQGNTSGQAKVVKCYNYQGEGHITRRCTQPKRRRDASRFKEKVLIVQAHAKAKAVLMANISSCDLDVLSEAIVQYTNTSAQQNSIIIPMFKQMSNHVTNWDKTNNNSKTDNESLTVELERYKEQAKILEQIFNVDLSSLEKFIDSKMDDMIRMKNTKFAAFETKIDTLKHTLSKHVKGNESLLTTLNGFKMELKQRESKFIDKEIVLENKNKELENMVYMKDILLQRMLDEDYEHGHEDHRMAVDALQKLVLCDVKDYFGAEKAEKQAKKKRKQDSPKTPPGSPPSPPPPPPELIKDCCNNSIRCLDND